MAASPPPTAPLISGFSSGVTTPASTTSVSPTALPASAPPAQHAPHSNPKVAELQTMFPTVDPGVIEIVLESVGGSQDRAIEQLLAITDENFKPEEGVGARREAESQVDLDAEFARSLQLEDEQQSRQYQSAQRQDQAGFTNPGAGGLPYQARVRRNQPPQQAYQQNNEFDHDRYSTSADGPPAGAGAGMLQVEEKLQRAAEAGKQTFNNLFSLAKTKYAEFQQSQATQQAQRAGASGGQGQGSGGGLWGGEQEYNQQQPSAAGWGRAGYGGSGSSPGGGRGGMQNYGYGQQQGQGQAYGARGAAQDDSRSFSTRSESFSDTFSSASDSYDRDPPSDPRPVIRPSSNRWNPSDTYEDPLPPGRSTPTGGRDGFGAAGRKSPAPGVGSPENRGPAKIDASKLGLLPKKKVDLLSSSPSSPSAASSLQGQAAASGPAAGPATGGSARRSPDIHTKNESGSADPNPSIPGASASVISKIPPTPPGRSRATFGLEDSDDELEYTRNPFDEK